MKLPVDNELADLIVMESLKDTLKCVKSYKPWHKDDAEYNAKLCKALKAVIRYHEP
jgi:hypothetical protein